MLVNAFTKLFTNVDPIVEMTLKPIGSLHEAVNLLGKITDLGKDDIHTVEWNLGDGTTLSAVLQSTHVYDKAGFHTVTLTVMDDDGGIGSHMIRIYVPGKNFPMIIISLLIVIICAIALIGWQFPRLR